LSGFIAFAAIAPRLVGTHVGDILDCETPSPSAVLAAVLTVTRCRIVLERVAGAVPLSAEQ